jgi:HK97 family phage portal protein
MRIFGLEIRRSSTEPTVERTVGVPVSERGGWWPVIREAFAGAWQRNIEWTSESVLAHHAVYACVTLIASDIGKLRPKLVEQDKDGIWTETESAAFSPVLRKPNRYQNRIQFIEWWVTSKLMRGNTYALKQKDAHGLVTALYLLDPSRVKVLVAPDGSVFYQLSDDNLSGLKEAITVPASEIIHDRMNCLFHPLVGVSPIFASGAAANIGLKITANSTHFFASGSNPSGTLTAPGHIPPDTAKRLKDEWTAKYSGENSGAVAVLGDSLKWEPMRMSAVDSQMIEHLKYSAETVASTFHVPAFKIGVGQMPAYSNGEILDLRYYSDCLQSLIEQFELCMDEGLGLDQKKDGKTLGVELDLDGLLRMDKATQVKMLAEGVKGSIYAPNDARKVLDLKPVKGGESPMAQQQNYSLAALADRDADKPFSKPTNPETPPPADPPADPAGGDDTEERAAILYWKAATYELTRAA